jgi:outer membrane protein assembly factor BamB
MEPSAQETAAEISPAGTQAVAKVLGSKPMFRRGLCTALLAGWALAGCGPAPAAESGEPAILPRIGVDRGICVLVGDQRCSVARELAGHSELTVLVQLARDEDVQAAARAADEAGLYGRRIFVAHESGARIGLADNVADSVVVLAGSPDIPRTELLRVLRPAGKALVGPDEFVKPFPDGIDEWRHHYHGPDNNTQSRDLLARAPYLTQFVADPRFAPAPQATVAAAGRVFMAVGHVAWHQREEAWTDTLVAINGFNGTILWRRPLTSGIMVDRSTMTATPESLYVGDERSCKILDAATGRVRDEIAPPAALAGGTFWKWMALEGGVLYALLGQDEFRDAKAQWRRTEHGWPWDRISKGYNDPRYRWGFGQTLLAIDPATKKVLWHHAESVAIDSRSLCMAGGRLFFCSFGSYLACLDTATGRQLWRRTADKDPDVLQAVGPYRADYNWINGWQSTAYAKCTPQALYLLGPELRWLTALSAEDGRFLWKHPVKDLQLVIRDDGLYLIGSEVTKSETRKLDPLSGRVLATYETCRRACTRATGTADGILFRAAEGSGRFDLPGGAMHWISAMRPSCQVGVIVSDGLLYWIPWACDCDLQLTGAICCGPAGDFNFQQPAGADRLEKPPAGAPPLAELPQSPADWPTYRADNARSARSQATIPDQVRLLWRQAGRSQLEITAPVVVGGLALVGGWDGTVRAVDTADGRLRWTAYVGGQVRFPPTVAAGRALVGSGDGWVYALEAATGRRLWRFRAAPAERRIPVYGLLLSTWPVASGVLVADGVAYCAAGINDFDGTHVYALDAASGRLRWQNNTAGHLDASPRGVACQGELLLDDNRLYLAGGNAVSPGVFQTSDGRCLNAPPTSHGSVAVRGRELTLADGQVRVSGQPLYADPDLPVYDQSARWQPDVVKAENAVLSCIERPGQAGRAWDLVARRTGDAAPLWSVPLPADPVRRAVAVAADGRIIVALRNGELLGIGR